MGLKQFVLKIAKASGVYAIVRDSAWRRRRLLILCYHGVAVDDEAEWDPELYVTQDRLRQRLHMLRHGGYTILPLAEATRRLYDGTLPARSVALTFDDGAVDFERRALPVLREFNAPATLYLTTFYCATRLPVFDTMLTYLLWKGRESGADVAALCESPVPLPIASGDARAKARETLFQFAVDCRLNAEEKDEFLARVARRVGADYADIRLKLADEVAPDMTSSMHHDLERGNPLEVRWLAGAVVDLGQRAGVPTPLNRAVNDILALHADGRKS